MVAGRCPMTPPDTNSTPSGEQTQERLKASVPESTYRLWLEPLEAAGAEGDTLFLTAPEGIRAWSERRYSALIAEALRDCGSRPGAGELRRAAELGSGPQPTPS